MALTLNQIETERDGAGNITGQKEIRKTIQQDTEPDYIKIYTAMWFDFEQFPLQYRDLFVQLAIRMSYCCTGTREDRKKSQVINVAGYIRDEIMQEMNWKNESSLNKGLKALCACGAIRKMDKRGWYQVNPKFAGKGAWRYNRHEKQGGIKDLRACFDFASHEMETNITYIDYNNEKINATPKSDEYG